MTILREHWDRVVGWTCVGLGALAIVAGWFGVSGTEYPAEQLSYIASGGLGGLFLLGLGTTMLLSADLRDEWVLVHRLTTEDRAPADDRVTTATVTPHETSSTSRDEPRRGRPRQDGDGGRVHRNHRPISVDRLEAVR